MIILAYIGLAAAILNIWAVTGIVACATRNWHPIKRLIERIR